MLRLSFLVVAMGAVIVAGPGAARADMTIYVEDFEENGQPGCDPTFNHQFTASPYLKPGSPVYWELRDVPSSPEYGTALLLAPAQDAISFLLPPGQEVVYASVDACMWGSSSLSPENYSVDFIGCDGSLRILLGSSLEWETVEVSSAEIGPINEIQMRCSEGFFDNITIHVIPDPSLAILLLAGLAISCVGAVVRPRR